MNHNCFDDITNNEDVLVAVYQCIPSSEILLEIITLVTTTQSENTMECDPNKQDEIRE